MTGYNSKIYQINGLTFDDNPEQHVFFWDRFDRLTDKKTQEKTNMVEYF